MPSTSSEPLPPSVQASYMDVLRDLWVGAGFTNIETRTISVSRSYASFEEFWTIATAAAAIRPILDGMPQGDAEQVKSRVRARLPADAAGRIADQSTANAIKGCVPV